MKNSRFCFHPPPGGGNREQYFLTEEGLYQVLFITRSELVNPFRKWVVSVIKNKVKNAANNEQFPWNLRNPTNESRN